MLDRSFRLRHSADALRVYSVSLCKRDKIGVAVRNMHRRLIVLVKICLQFTHHSQAVVPHDYHFYGNFFLYDSCKLHHLHLERAVAADSYYFRVGGRKLRSHRRRDRVSHCAHTAACEETSSLKLEIVASPNLVLTNVRNAYRVVGKSCRKLSYKHFRVDVALGLVLLGDSVLYLGKLRQPVGTLRAVKPRRKLRKNIFAVAHKGNINVHILAYFRRVDIYMDNFGSLC